MLLENSIDIVTFIAYYILGMAQIGGIILAGGKSSRMGEDKAFILFRRKMLIEYSLNLVQKFCNPILISANSNEYERFGFPVINDEETGCGPLGGIYSCLQQSDTDWNFVLSVDSPFVESEFIHSLILHIGNFDAVVPFSEKGKEPLIALYHKNSLAVIEKMLKSNNFKMHNLLRTINTKFVDSQFWVEKYPQLFRNLNRPEDFDIVK